VPIPRAVGGGPDGARQGAALGRIVIYVTNVSGHEWMSCPYPPETWATLGPGGHENTLGCAVKAAGRNAEMLRSIQVLLKPLGLSSMDHLMG